MPTRQSALAHVPETGDLVPPSATDLPEEALVPTGRVPDHETPATMCPWELHPSESPFTKALRPSKYREPAQWDVCSQGRRCILRCTSRTARQPASLKPTHDEYAETRRGFFAVPH